MKKALLAKKRIPIQFNKEKKKKKITELNF